ncbi:MAG: twitching motility protein PilT [Thermodesulfobacteriota bacterium]|nr:twitching motility protein PilT [Thermodesulfobacteriota bacterium]
MKIRESHSLAVAAGKAFMKENICQIVSVTPDDFVLAWNIFVQFRDKGWSLTDCTSKVIIERLDISIVFSFDQHFEQFGSVMRVP